MIYAPRKKWTLTKNMDNSLLFLSRLADTTVVVKWELHTFQVSEHNTVACKHGHYDGDNVST